MFRKQFGYFSISVVCVFFLFLLLSFSFSFGLILFDQPRFFFLCEFVCVCAPQKPNYTEFWNCFLWNSEKWVNEQSQLLVVVYNLSYVICYVECIRDKWENVRFFFLLWNKRKISLTHTDRNWMTMQRDRETKKRINWRETIGINWQRESFNADPIHPYEKLLIGLFKHKEKERKQ